MTADAGTAMRWIRLLGEVMWAIVTAEFQLPLRREPIRSSVEQKGRSWASSHSSSWVCSLA